MKVVECLSCGANDLYEEDGYIVCKYCGAKHKKTVDDIEVKGSSIELNDDVKRLLEKMRSDPSRATKYAQLILTIDPYNKEAQEVLKPKNVQVQSGGCYVATAVYGSYDCPEVWTLRRYRDNTLAEHWCGRAFICVYYAVSPTLVKLFGDTRWFKAIWRTRLDKMVKSLQEKGVESTPYQDRIW